MSRRRLVLGFDSSCCHCSRVAAAVREAAGGKLDVMGLDETPMREWRVDSTRQEPTLVVVTSNGGRVRTRIHTGRGLPLVLAARLGPIPAVRVLTALGGSRGHGYRTDAQSGRLSRRTLLGGLVSAAGLVLGAATIGRHAGGSAPIETRPLDPGSPELSRARANPAVRAAADRFGTADWSRVVVARDPSDGSWHYVVRYASDRNGTAQLLTNVSGRDPALVVRQLGDGGGTGQVDFYDVRGVPLGSLAIGGPSAFDPTGPTLPADIYRGSVGPVRLVSAQSPLDRAFFRCFGNCLQANGAQDAIDPCFSCVTGNYIYCLECTLRAGFQAKKCYGECGGPQYA